jgi:hypothetical protein
MTKTTRRKSVSVEPSKTESVRSITKRNTAMVVIVMIQMTTRTRRSATGATRADVNRQVTEVDMSRAMAAASRSTAAGRRSTARMEITVLTIIRRADKASTDDSNKQGMDNRNLAATVDSNSLPMENKSTDVSSNPPMASRRAKDVSKSTVVVGATRRMSMKRMSTDSVVAVSEVETIMAGGIRVVWTLKLRRWLFYHRTSRIYVD